jgi:hypothetical protein
MVPCLHMHMSMHMSMHKCEADVMCTCEAMFMSKFYAY